MLNDNSSATTNDGAIAYPVSTPPTAQDQASSLAVDGSSSMSVSPEVPSYPSTTPVPDAAYRAEAPTGAPFSAPKSTESSGPIPSIYSEVARRISDSKNVLIALSSNPSVDEMAAAIGLSLYLDRLGKRATAIYSGNTPNALEFLKPEETFESSADTLQDFVIALSKEKADHLRYKLDGSYVKIYITPYRSRISEEDLDFSYGDYNVDLVLALDVANGIDLDAALREHGRIMHDAVIINITTGRPGKFGEIEWSDKSASSVSEMISRLLYSVDSEVKVGKEEATAFLTGIVAATNRFSKANTTPETMRISSLLMESGANQQLVSKNITPDIDNELISLSGHRKARAKDDSTKLDIGHSGEAESSAEVGARNTKNEVAAKVTRKEHTLLDDLKAAEESLSRTGAETTPEVAEEPFRINSDEVETPAAAEKELRNSSAGQIEDSDFIIPSDKPDSVLSEPHREILEPSAELKADFSPEPAQPNLPPTESQSVNPALASAPKVPDQPEINGVPEISYMPPMPGDDLLPPPPTPPIDSVAPAPESVTPARPANPVDSVPSPSSVTGPAAPASSSVSSNEPFSPTLPPVQTGAQANSANPSTTPPDKPATPSPLGSQPAMQDQVYVPQAADPSAFKIPGL